MPSSSEARWWSPFFPQLNVVGFLNSAHERLRPSLLDFLFSDPSLPAAIVVIVVVIVAVVIIEGPGPQTKKITF